MGFTLGGWQQFGAGSVLADLVGQNISANRYLAANGTAALPAFGASSAAGYGLFFSSGATVSLAVGGSEAVQVTSTGVVIALLQAIQSSVGNGAIGFQLNTAGARLKFSSGGTTDYLSGDGATKVIAAGVFDAAGGIVTIGGLNAGITNATGGTALNYGTAYIRVVSDVAGLIELGGASLQRIYDTSGPVSIGVGSARTGAAIVGNLNLQSTPVSNASTTETDLFTYSLPLNTLTTTNRGIRVTCYGSNTGSATTKTLRFYFGALLQTVILPITNAGDWELVATIVRTGASAQRYAIRLGEENDASATVASWTVTQGTTAQTETAAITIKVTGQDSVGAGTVTANLWSVDAI